MTDAKARKVLVVEDNELNMRLFCDLLDAYGYETYQCRDGAKAVEIARREQPDLIIMDIQLPEVSGLDITRWLKDDEKVAHIPVLAVTAFAMRADEQRVREAGCEGYLSKPIQIMTFIKAVESLMPKEAA
ncbi:MULTISPECIES: response regulator [unclassified Hyphomonas]|jgi:two-component system cell cycle response regulator DivK|uniref:response regulator n=1 Tax=unclassified Hyphomonas TaxID=2630699 RepID=UPI000458DFBE|nr:MULTISPECIES: response regulator [unclassified Hyphomonas]KCZ46403.1 chemotaxis protein CheY [Hyphomonas sp. CY54-11-8]RAN40900.1 chemotaxis protein CheY [Hyphomonas sp. GM-8P]